jgi:hypothetical protein
MNHRLLVTTLKRENKVLPYSCQGGKDDRVSLVQIIRVGFEVFIEG